MRHSSIAASVATVVVSALAAGAFLTLVYSPSLLLSALSRANLELLALAVGLGLAMQGLRAWRACKLLSPGSQIRYAHTYQAMVVGHGLGDLVPLVPGGPALRCLLTERLSAVPIAFSAGVFMLEGVLDGLGPAVLIVLMLALVREPTWVRGVMVAVLIQSVILLALPPVMHLAARLSPLSALQQQCARLGRLSAEVVNGLVSILGRDRRMAGWLLAVSLALTALSGIQLALLLDTFQLTVSAAALSLILVFSLAAGSLPIKIPGSGTVATAAVLQVAGVHGAGVAAFVLVSRVISSSQTTVLAGIVLGGWTASGQIRDLRLGDTLARLNGNPLQRIRAPLSALLVRLRSGPARDAAIVAATALGLRLAFGGLTASTFDPDEFVFLALSRALAHGQALYSTIIYFHPPGLLVLLAALHTLLAWWWPAGRLVMVILDSVTAVFVWRIGVCVLGRKGGLLAGLIYAMSPVALLSSVRIGPDPVITALGTLGLMLLVTRPSRAATLAAAFCLALAVWTKYTALLYLPIYLVAAPSRARLLLVSWAGTLLCLFAPYLQHASTLYRETVLWQMQRPHADFVNRVASVGAFWLAFNPLAVIGARYLRSPGWVRLGFGMGILFLITAQTYYHYFAPLVPFAALLAAPLVERISRAARRTVALIAVVAAALWGLDVGYGSLPQRLFVSATRFSQLEQTSTVLDHRTNTHEAVLSDEFEYPLLAHRKAVNYFWNMTASVSTKALIQCLPAVAAVVETRGAGGYPNSFTDYLEDRHYAHVDTADTIVWLTAALRPGGDRVALRTHRTSCRLAGSGKAGPPVLAWREPPESADGHT